jgi:hypothetical protein
MLNAIKDVNFEGVNWNEWTHCYGQFLCMIRVETSGIAIEFVT